MLAGTLGTGYLSRITGIIPVLAIQGAGYVVAGLVMLILLGAGAGARPVGRRQEGAERFGEGGRVLVAADEGLRPLTLGANAAMHLQARWRRLLQE